jgi:importin subunit beta-1
LAIGTNFVHFLEPTMVVLGQAGKFQLDATAAVDYETLDYMNALREAIAEAYTGVIQGLKQNSGSEIILNDHA